ncbi:hypothetical protein K1719_015950 [Acacia pycnantha]|nr:hypothetical protein K1719_015950 [Acacia pycnantha]
MPCVQLPWLMEIGYIFTLTIVLPCHDSEELKTPRSSDDEEHDSETLAQFNEKAEFGHVYLELGMEFKLKALNEAAWKYLENIEPGAWVKAYYSHGPKCDNITNNVSEVWNSKIRTYRAKPILSMCEELRCYIMRRMAAQAGLGTVRGR